MSECSKRFELTPRERSQMGLGTVKRWALCLDSDRPLRGLILVCPCQGCGKKCPGYKPEEEEDANVVQ
jgi:hypothetical protein